MSRIRLLALLVAIPAVLVAVVPPADAARVSPNRPVHTYSIVARDSVTGDMGVAVQSHWFSVGPVVPWARAGVGAVATQSLVLVSYGPLGLDLMEEGMSAREALEKLLEEDEHPSVRQVAMVDNEGNVATHTGDSCIAFASHRAGSGYSVQANMMLTDKVPAAMAAAYEKATGDLADRMLAALEAAEGAGGDIRGRQSAAILIVSGTASEEPWRDVIMDLRVEDHPRPVEELKRLVILHRAYAYENLGDEAMAENDLAAALEAYGEAARLAPDNLEIAFWQGVSLLNVGRDEEGLAIVKRVVERDPNWKELLARLPKAGLLVADEARLAKLLSAL